MRNSGKFFGIVFAVTIGGTLISGCTTDGGQKSTVKAGASTMTTASNPSIPTVTSEMLLLQIWLFYPTF